VKGIQVCSNKIPDPLQRRVQKGWGHFKIFYSRTPWLEKPIFTQKLSDIVLSQVFKIMVLSCWVGPYYGKPFLLVLIWENILKNLLQK
jgi:hypothetical protein